MGHEQRARIRLDPEHVRGSRRMRELNEIVADLPRARSNVVSPGADVDFVVSHYRFEFAIDDALVRRPETSDRRIDDARMVTRIAELDGREQAIGTGAARHAAEQCPCNAAAGVAD